MKKNSVARSLPEEMGLQLEDTATLGLVDALLVIALLLSGAAWLVVSIVGPELGLLSALASVGGRLLAASIGVASVVAVIRSLFSARWPLSESDGSLF